MAEIFKVSFLNFCKLIGLFRFAKWLNRKNLRILCYHSFSNEDVVKWRPGVFMRPSTLKKRLDHLDENGYSVILLDDAVKMLKENRLPDHATVITIDDGWADTKGLADELFQEKNYPYTVYVTSYYSKKQTPVFNVVVAYLFWKTTKKIFDCEGSEFPCDGLISMDDNELVRKMISDIIEYGQVSLDNDGRVKLMKQLAEKLDVDYVSIEESRVLTLLSEKEIKEMADSGVDIQLHTHRHLWPSDEKEALKELDENEKYLEPLVNRPLKHLCYPNGGWSQDQLVFLEKAKIESATTCNHDLNTKQTNPLFLNRFLDGEEKSQIVFEAEISGFKNLLSKFIKF